MMPKSFMEREDEIRMKISKGQRYLETEDLSFDNYISALDHVVILRYELMDLYKEWETHESQTG